MVAVSIVKSKGELLVVGLLNYLWPSLTLLLSIPILHYRANWWLLPGALAVLTGLVMSKVATAPAMTIQEVLTHINPWAYSLAALDAIAWALYSNYSRKLSNPEGASAVPMYMVLGSLLLFIASVQINELRSPTVFSWIVLFFWSLATALSYLFWDVGMRFGNVVTISTTSMLIPLFSTIVTAILLGHGITPSLIIAAGLVALGSQVCRRGVA
jgi:drug/metabolite transporter (DMT)-like permease